MPKEEWIKYCNEEESDRNILEEGLYLLSFLGFLIFLATPVRIKEKGFVNSNS